MNISTDVFSLITTCSQMYKNMLISKLSHEGSCKFVIRYDVLTSGVDNNHITYNIYIFGKKVSHVLARGWYIFTSPPPVLLYTKSWDSVNISAQGCCYLAFLRKFWWSCPHAYFWKFLLLVYVAGVLWS